MLAALVLATLVVPASRDTSKVAAWRVDPAHSELTFHIRHLVGRVSGTFTDWDATIVADPANWSSGKVSVRIRSGSIDTNNEKRDTDLRSEKFFYAQEYPEISFVSTKVEVQGDSIRLSGDLTIRGRTKPVVLEGKYLGITPGKNGMDRIGFEAATRINRLDFGVSWNRAVEGGGVLLGDDVDIDVVIEALRRVGTS